MRDRERGRPIGDRDAVTAGGDDDEGFLEADFAALGSPPANIDSSGVPGLDLGAGGGSFDPDLDEGSAGGLGTGLGATRGGPAGMSAGPAAGVGSSARAKLASISGVDAASDPAVERRREDGTDVNENRELASETAEAGNYATTSMGSDDPQDVESDIASVRQSDLGAASLGDARGPGAGLGGSRG
jgi:hypothetical protein